MFRAENLHCFINGKLLHKSLPLLEVVEDMHDLFQILMEDSINCLVPHELLPEVSERLMRNVHILLVLCCCNHFVKLFERPLKALGSRFEA